MKKIKFWINAIIGYLKWRAYDKMGCLLCEKRDKKDAWCIMRRKSKKYRYTFCYKFKLGYTKKR